MPDPTSDHAKLGGVEPPPPVLIPNRSLVVLVGPSGSGKTSWAGANFRADQIVSADAIRGLVGIGPHDQRAGTDAFDVLSLVLERRLKRGLITVVDSLGLDDDKRAEWIDLARRRGRPVHAVAFDTPARECRSRNKARERPVPTKVLTGQLKRFESVGPRLIDEFDAVHRPGPARVLPSAFAGSGPARERQERKVMPMRFGLQVSNFTWPGGDEEIGPHLASVARQAEEAGFSSLWVMDHFIQIPSIGREWEPMLDSYTTLGFLAASTERIRLGAMVSGVTYRNVAHLGKIVATLDVLSGGRAACGLGAAWFDREHAAYGWDFPSLAERYELLEDALELLPLMWGPGSPGYEGRRITIPEAICYPRPLQERVPVLVGGSGERKTLKLVARHADACNIIGEPDVVERKVEVLRRHCESNGRDPSEITVTQLSTVLSATDEAALVQRVEQMRSDATSPEHWAERMKAGTVEDHIGRFRLLAEAGVEEAVVGLADIGLPGAIDGFAPIIDAFR